MKSAAAASTNKVIELGTYILVPFVIFVALPLLGKFVDSFYFHYPNVLADSLPMILSGASVIACGTALVGWTIFLFKTVGQGTPNPALPPRVFVVSGPYRFSRNPMALGALLQLLGETAIYYSPSLLGIVIVFGTVVYLTAIFIEEPVLRKRFGASYREYLEQVPRLFPNPWKWR